VPRAACHGDVLLMRIGPQFLPSSYGPGPTTTGSKLMTSLSNQSPRVQRTAQSELQA
jgi:hypothetical protein